MKITAIKLLDDSVINKIAAGEVVERPVSIVRELVDNAIDAGATSIEVQVTEGGQAQIRVRDNGSGMNPEDALLCFKRHATSKISRAEDLEEINTLGFRGEALSSISAVAKVQLRSQQAGAGHGTEVIYEDSQLVSSRPWTGSVGTEFEVSRLFANLPARKKFLKSPRTDLAKITDWVYCSALAHPTIRYKLLSGTTEVLFLPAHADIYQRLSALMQGTTIRVAFSAGPFSVKGIVAHPAQVESKLPSLVFLVNSRPVVDKLLIRAVRDAWSTGLRSSEAPVGALEINLPTSEVDINVHPQKSEVRFRNSQAVFGSLFKAIKMALAEWQPVSQHASIPQSIQTESAGPVYNYQPSQIQLNNHVVAETSINFESTRFLGQVLGAFLIFERDGRVFVVDSHAAHERIRFNQLSAWAAERQKPTQMLLLPQKIELPEEIVSLISEKKAQLNKIGFEFSEKEEGVELSQYPSDLKFSELKWFLESVAVSEYEDLTTSLTKIVESSLARKACRSSVMSGQLLSEFEARELWNKIKSEPHGAVCPHGRPVMVELTREQLDSMFLRDGFA